MARAPIVLHRARASTRFYCLARQAVASYSQSICIILLIRWPKGDVERIHASLGFLPERRSDHRFPNGYRWVKNRKKGLAEVRRMGLYGQGVDRRRVVHSSSTRESPNCCQATCHYLAVCARKESFFFRNETVKEARTDSIHQQNPIGTKRNGLRASRDRIEDSSCVAVTNTRYGTKRAR